MWIKERIDAEYRKHKKLDWSKLAEAKIKSQIKYLVDRFMLEKLSEANKVKKYHVELVHEDWQELIKRLLSEGERSGK